MKIYDLHIHTRGNLGDPDALLKQLEEAGIYGAGIFSPRPLQGFPPVSPGIIADGMDYEERVENVLNFCKPYPDRLFPVLFIHPYEDGAVEKAKDAAARGIRGFKIMCNNYYVYDDTSMALISTIAKLNRPALFHTGILWDGTPSGDFNRPVNWEHMLDVPGLKFSTAHCAWPWYDECIALYGKLQNAYQTRKNACEMFLDLTPGTPVIYRRDLITKLHTVGYDVKHNILFGTDCATDYNVDYSKQWQEIDNGLYRELGVDEETRRCIYHDNFLRFFGVTNEVYVKAPLNSDGRK